MQRKKKFYSQTTFLRKKIKTDRLLYKTWYFSDKTISQDSFFLQKKYIKIVGLFFFSTFV